MANGKPGPDLTTGIFFSRDVLELQIRQDSKDGLSVKDSALKCGVSTGTVVSILKKGKEVAKKVEVNRNQYWLRRPWRN